MKKTRVSLLLLALAMIAALSLNPFKTAQAAEPTITVQTVEAQPGEDVQVTISISNNPGICTMYIDVAYDSSLTLTRIEDSKLLVGGLMGKTLSANPITLSWDDSTADEDNTSNGVIATLTFTVAEGASGSLPVSVTYNPAQIYNLDLDNITFAVVNGGVTIAGGEHEHVWGEYVSNNDATCTADGTKTAKCLYCDATDTQPDVGSALGHDFGAYVSDGNATCTADGTKTRTCSRCDAFETVADEGSALGHTWGEYAANNDATCTKNGTETAKCIRCDETDTREIEDSMLPHTVEEWNVTKEPTGTEPGEKTGVCTVCGQTVTEEIDPLPTVLTDPDNGAKVEGKDGLGFPVEAEFNAVDVTVNLPEGAQEKLDEILEGLETEKKIIRVYSLELLLNGRPYAFDGTVTVTIDLGANALKNVSDLQLFHLLDNGEVEEVQFTVNGTALSFDATGFSLYALLGVRSTAQPLPTGDSLMLLVALVAVSAAAVAGGVYFGKKKAARR